MNWKTRVLLQEKKRPVAFRINEATHQWLARTAKAYKTDVAKVVVAILDDAREKEQDASFEKRHATKPREITGHA